VLQTGDKAIPAFRLPNSTTGISTRCMLTWYAGTTHAGSSRGWPLTESVLEPANMEFAVSDNLDRGARLELYRICATTRPGRWWRGQEWMHRGRRL